MIKKGEKDKLVTRGYLEERLEKFQRSFISDLIKEERAMLHEALLESLENAKVYHQKETDRYIGALISEWKEESKAFHDYMKGIKDTCDRREKRLSDVENAIAVA